MDLLAEDDSAGRLALRLPQAALPATSGAAKPRTLRGGGSSCGVFNGSCWLAFLLRRSRGAPASNRCVKSCSTQDRPSTSGRGPSDSTLITKSRSVRATTPAARPTISSPTPNRLEGVGTNGVGLGSVIRKWGQAAIVPTPSNSPQSLQFCHLGAGVNLSVASRGSTNYAANKW